jgi:hypothetical protein
MLVHESPPRRGVMVVFSADGAQILLVCACGGKKELRRAAPIGRPARVRMHAICASQLRDVRFAPNVASLQ